MQATGENNWSHGRGTSRFRNAISTEGIGNTLLPRRDSLLVHLIDACLLSLLFIAPLLMGGRHPVGQLAWMLIAALLGLATLLHYRPRVPSAGDFIWLTAAVLVMLQLVPLPTNLLVWLNPGLGELLPGMIDPEAIPFSETIYSQRPLSINPYQTRLALGMLLAYGIVFHAVTRRVQTTDDVRRLLRWIAIASVAIGTLALLQRFAGNGKFLWVYQHVTRSASDAVRGPFQNQNHLAQLMALGLGPLLYFAISQPNYGRAIVASGGTTLCLLTGLLTFSRGGAIAVATAGVVTVAGFIAAGVVNRKQYLRLGIAALVTITLLGIWGGSRLLSRLDSLTGGTELSDVAPGRWELWQAHLHAIAASPWLGYGAATQADIYPAFIEKDFGKRFSHGESGYLPIQLENGLPGTFMIIAALWLTIHWGRKCLRTSRYCDRQQRHRRNQSGDLCTLGFACLGGLAASAVQSVADFVWYIPACITPALMLLACLYRLASLAGDPGQAVPSLTNRSRQVPWLVLPAAGLVAALPWGIGQARASHLWDRYRELKRDGSIEPGADVSAQSQPAEAIALLEAAIRRDPSAPTPRLRLAAELLAIAEHPEQRTVLPKSSLVEESLRQSIRGLRAAPLQSEGYIVLAHVLHSSGIDGDHSQALLKQALRVRRSDTFNRYQVGLAAFRAGRAEWGLKVWEPMLETPSPERNQIVVALADLLPADLLLQTFSLDHTALTILYQRHDLQRPRNSELCNRLGHRLVDALIEATETAPDDAARAEFFHRASHLHQEIKGISARTIELASRAVEASPSQFRYRVRLAELLVHDRQWDKAEQQLRWCKLRKPSDPTVARHEAQLHRLTRQE